MKVSSLLIRNIGNIRELDITPGNVTVFEGDNGTGKTSALDALSSLLKAPSAELIRHGEAKGEIVMILDDGMKISRTITPTGNSLKVWGSDGIPIDRAPQTVLNSLFNSSSLNPVEFLTSSPKDRIALLLKAVPLEFTLEQKKRLAQMPLWNDAMLKRQPIDLLDGFSKAMFDERTILNRELKLKDANIAELSRTLPNSIDDLDYEFTIAEIESEIKTLETKRDAKVEEVRSALKIQTDEVTGTAAKRIKEIEDERDSKIKTLELEATEEKESISSEYNGEISSHKEKLATLREQEKSAVIQRSVYTNVEKQKTEAELCRQNAEELTNARGEIQKIRVELCQKLPSGLAIEDGELVKDGIPFERLNTAQQVSIALKLSVDLAGELKLIQCDRLECLGVDAFEEFEKQADASGCQYFVTQVTTDPALIARDGKESVRLRKLEQEQSLKVRTAEVA